MGKFSQRINNSKAKRPAKGPKPNKAAATGATQGKTLDLGMQSGTYHIRKAKTHKGRKILEGKAPKIFENKKSAIFVKGNKSSKVITQLMRELHQLRGDPETSRIFMKKTHDMHPFDNVIPLESMASK